MYIFGISLYEIKNIEKISEQQISHLIDYDKCGITEFRSGKIIKKAVIYRGKPNAIKGIQYINVEEYLLNL